MYSVGSSIKLFYACLVIVSIYGFSDVLHVWRVKSSTDMSNGLIIHNFTTSVRCSEYKQCVYDMCLISDTNSFSVVTVSFPDNTVCEAPNWVNFNPVVIAYLAIFTVGTLIAVLSAALITMRDTRVFYRDYRISSRTWRLIRFDMFLVAMLYVVQVPISIYYRSTTMTSQLQILDVLDFVSIFISNAFGICLVGYFFMSSIKFINKKLDRSREGLEEDPINEPLVLDD